MLHFFDPLRELTFVSIVIRVFFVTLCTGIIGYERGHKGNAAGMRTYILVALGACSVMITNQYLLVTMNPNGDPARLGAQVISGIGFLGAGTILVRGQSKVTGLTTAAALWTSACIGIAVGACFFEGALIVSVVMFFTMTVLHKVELSSLRYKVQSDLLVELKYAKDLGALLRGLNLMNVTIVDINAGSFIQERPINPEGLIVIVTIQTDRKTLKISELMADLLSSSIEIIRMKEI